MNETCDICFIHCASRSVRNYTQPNMFMHPDTVNQLPFVVWGYLNSKVSERIMHVTQYDLIFCLPDIYIYIYIYQYCIAGCCSG